MGVPLAERKAANEMQAWENAYVFISSTFNDMHAERDYLVKRVFPELAEWCEARRLRLVDIDLRWGVTEKDSQENKRVVDVCLRNIDRCRPLFLCFLGQRRGWVPKRDDISEATFDAFPKLDSYLGSSVTEMEITHALIDPMLNGSVLELKNRERAFFFLRDPSYLDAIDDQNVRNVYTNEGEANPEVAGSHLEKLKERVRETGRPVFGYAAAWDDAATTPELLAPGKPEGIDRGRLTGFQCDGRELADVIIEQIKGALEELYPGREPEQAATPLQRELDEQARFLQFAQEGFIERTGDFDEVGRFIESEDVRPCAIVAPAGMGKTSHLATLVAKLSMRDDVEVLYRFVGASEGSVSVASLLASMADELATRFGIRNVPQTATALKSEFGDLLSQAADAMRVHDPAKKRLVVIIDAVNQLSTGLKDLIWIPAAFPVNVKFIYSFKVGEDEGDALLSTLIAAGKTEVVHVRPFESTRDRQEMVEQFLSLYLKQLDDDNIGAIVNARGADNPLFLKVLLSELRVFGSHEGLREKIAREFGDSPVSAFASVLKRLESDAVYADVSPQTLTRLVFGFLAHAKNGLSARELAELVFEQGAAASYEAAADAVNRALRQVRPFLANREGRHDFFYESFMFAAHARYGSANADWESAHWHAELARYFSAKPEDDTRRLFELPYQLAHAGKGDELAQLLSSFGFQFFKLGAFGVQALLDDLGLAQLQVAGVSAQNREALALVHNAIEMSADIIAQAPDQLATHEASRLSGFDDPLIQSSLADIDPFLRDRGIAWFKPLRPCMTPPGGNLVRIYEAGMLGASLFRDGKRMLVPLAADGSAKVVELRSGKVLQSLPLSKGLYAHLIEDENAFAVRGQGYLQLVNLDTGEAVRAEGYAGTDGGNPGIAFSGLYVDEDACYREGLESGIRVTDVKTGRLMHQFPSSLGNFCARFDEGAGLLYLTDELGQISVYDPAREFAHVRRYWLDPQGPRDPEGIKKSGLACREFALHPETHVIAAQAQGGFVQVIDLDDGRPLFRQPIGSQQKFALSDDGALLAVGGGAGSFEHVNVFSLETLQLQATIMRNRVGMDFDVPFLFVDGGTRLITATYNGRVELWDTRTGQLVEAFEGSKGGKPALAATDDGLLVFAGETVMVWDRSKKARKAARQDLVNFKLNTHDACALSPDETFLVALDSEGKLTRFDLDGGAMRVLGPAKKAVTFGMLVSADGAHCLTKDYDRFSVYSTETGEWVGEIPVDRTKVDHNVSFALPKEACIGPRGITVAIAHGGNILLADLDQPHDWREIRVFDDDIRLARMFEGGRKLFVRTGSEAKLLDTVSWECVEHSDNWMEMLTRCEGLDNYAQLAGLAAKEAKRWAHVYSQAEGWAEIIRHGDEALWHPGLADRGGHDIEWYELREANTRASICKFVFGQSGLREWHACNGNRFAFCSSFTGMMIFSLENASAACEKARAVAKDQVEGANAQPGINAGESPLRTESELDHLGLVLFKKGDLDGTHESFLVYTELVERFPGNEHHAKNRGIAERTMKRLLDVVGREDDVATAEKWCETYRGLAAAHADDESFATLRNYAEDKLAFTLSHREDIASKERAVKLYEGMVERGYVVERNAENLRIMRAQVAWALRKRGDEAESGVDDLQRAYDLYGKLARQYPDREDYRKAERSAEHKLAFRYIMRGQSGDNDANRRAFELYSDLAVKEPDNEGVAKNLRILKKRLS